MITDQIFINIKDKMLSVNVSDLITYENFYHKTLKYKRICLECISKFTERKYMDIKVAKELFHDQEEKKKEQQQQQQQEEEEEEEVKKNLSTTATLAASKDEQEEELINSYSDSINDVASISSIHRRIGSLDLSRRFRSSTLQISIKELSTSKQLFSSSDTDNSDSFTSFYNDLNSLKSHHQSINKSNTSSTTQLVPTSSLSYHHNKDQKFWLSDTYKGFILVNADFYTNDGQKIDVYDEYNQQNRKIYLADQQLMNGNQDTILYHLNSYALHNASILYHLKKRFINDQIYTNLTDNVLLSINPYKQLSIYTTSIMDQYGSQFKSSNVHHNQRKLHLFSFVNKCLLSKSMNQSMIILGTSSSGKTETMKLIIQYLTHAIFKSDLNHHILQGLLANDTIVQAFASCKTVKNNYSTRCSKLLKIVYHKTSYQLLNSSIVSYLFESQRLIDENSCNFHILYQLISACIAYKQQSYQSKANLFSKLFHHTSATTSIKNQFQTYIQYIATELLIGYESFNDFNYIKLGSMNDHQSLHDVDSLTTTPSSSSNHITSTMIKKKFLNKEYSKKIHNLSQNYLKSLQQTIFCLSKVGFNSDDIKNILRILSAILLLGNITKNDDVTAIADSNIIQHVATLFHISTDDLVNLLSVKRIKIGHNFIDTSLTMKESLYIRNQLASFIYSLLFTYVIKKLHNI